MLAEQAGPVLDRHARHIPGSVDSGLGSHRHRHHVRGRREDRIDRGLDIHLGVGYCSWNQHSVANCPGRLALTVVERLAVAAVLCFGTAGRILASLVLFQG